MSSFGISDTMRELPELINQLDLQKREIESIKIRLNSLADKLDYLSKPDNVTVNVDPNIVADSLLSNKNFLNAVRNIIEKLVLETVKSNIKLQRANTETLRQEKLGLDIALKKQKLLKQNNHDRGSDQDQDQDQIRI